VLIKKATANVHIGKLTSMLEGKKKANPRKQGRRIYLYFLQSSPEKKPKAGRKHEISLSYLV